MLRMMLQLSWLCILASLLSVSLSASIKGKLDLSPHFNITGGTIPRTIFKLYQIGNYSQSHAYSDQVQLKDLDGNFEFEGVPLNPGLNATTHYVLYSSSLDYNLKPNRILIEFKNSDNDGTNYEIKAFRNVFGKEFFPSADIVYPEQLESLQTDPQITITLVNLAPLRAYYQQRRKGFFQTGPLARLLDSRWKQAAAITGIAVILFPILLEKMDPDTAKAIKEEQQRKQREKYAVKQD